MSENVVLRIFADVQSTALGNEVVPEAVRGPNFLTDSSAAPTNDRSCRHICR